MGKKHPHVIHSGILVLTGVLFFCPNSFGQATECERVAARCHEKCRPPAVPENLSLYTDFTSQCNRSCSLGHEACNTQESQLSCNTFYYYCVAACPKTATDPKRDYTVKDPGVLSLCIDACGAGMPVCKAEAEKLPARERTGEAKTCEHARAACLHECKKSEPEDKEGYTFEGNNFPELCAAACAQGVPACNASSGASQCDEFLNQCDQACPAGIKLKMGLDFYDTNSKSLCHNSCASGRVFCKHNLHLPIIPEEDYPGWAEFVRDDAPEPVPPPPGIEELAASIANAAQQAVYRDESQKKEQMRAACEEQANKAFAEQPGNYEANKKEYYACLETAEGRGRTAPILASDYAEQQERAAQERMASQERSIENAKPCAQQLLQAYPDGGRSDPNGYQKGFLACVDVQSVKKKETVKEKEPVPPKRQSNR